MSFYVEATMQLVGDDGKPLTREDVELVADVVMGGLANAPGDLDVAANLESSELTVCGFFEAPTARAAVDQADDLLKTVAGVLGDTTLEPTSVSARPAELLNA